MLWELEWWPIFFCACVYFILYFIFSGPILEFRIYPPRNKHSQWKWAIPKGNIIFQLLIFRGYVCFREGNLWIHSTCCCMMLHMSPVTDFNASGLARRLVWSPRLSGTQERQSIARASFHNERYIAFSWVFPRIVFFSPKASILIGFSILNHPNFGGWKHPYADADWTWFLCRKLAAAGRFSSRSTRVDPSWSNYSDLTRPHPKWWFSKGTPLISGKSRLVKYYNLARSKRNTVSY